MKITKRQLRRIIKEERTKLHEQGMPRGMQAAGALEFAMDEFGLARTEVSPELTGEEIREEILNILSQWLNDATLNDGRLDTSRWR